MRALIVVVNYPTIQYDPNKSKDELIALGAALDIEVVDEVYQNIDKIRPSTFIGSGKILEIKERLEDDMVVIFDEELSPLQMKNIVDILEVDVIDRSDLILRIFKQRAKTKEAKLQVEIASYQYILPRLVGSNASLTGQMGGSNFRGSGEKQIELDRRKIYQQLFLAKKQLASIVTKRQTQRKKRKQNNTFVIALVGYTNSGKSTLVNVLSNNKEKEVFQKDMLFATLETASRQAKIKNINCIVSDTVGFVHRLPHHLVQAFRSTLEEIQEADLILHVIDSSSDEYQLETTTTKEVLESLGVSDIPILHVYNKIDKNKYGWVIPNDPYVYISASKKMNIDVLKDKIAEFLFKDYEYYEYVIPYHQGEVFSYLQQHTNVEEVDYTDKYIYVKGNGSQTIIEKYKKYNIQH